LVLERLKEQPGVYLLVEDGSEISFSGKKPIEGLGFIANGQEGLQGFLLHSVLAMRWWWGDDAQNGDGKRPPVEVLGLAAQSYRVRHEKRGRGKETSTHSKKRGRESEEWLTSGATLGAAPSNPAIRWVRVADRGADIYEFLKDCEEKGHGFVVRSAQERGILEPETGEPKGRLFEAVRQAPSLGEFVLELRARKGQAARSARLQVSALCRWL